MRSPLERLYKTKFALLAVIATVAGYVLMLVGNWVATQPGMHVLKDVDLFDIGIAVMTSGLIGVAFQFVGNADATAENKRQFREVIREEAPTIRDSVVDAWAFTPEKMLDITAPEVLDRVIENSLAKQLGDQTFAAAVYQDLKAQVLRSAERWHDLRVSVDLSLWQSARTLTAAPMFVATVRFDYHVSNPTRIIRFASVTDLDEYRELQADPSITEVWYFQSKPELDVPADEVFQVVEVTIDGKRQTIRRTSKAGTQLFSVYLGPEVEKDADDVTVSFTYRALVQQHGHVLFIDLTRPIEGLSMNFAYGGTGIRYVSVADYIGTATQPAISRRPASDPSPSVSLTFDDWIMPKAGVVFTWVLETEVPRSD